VGVLVGVWVLLGGLLGWVGGGLWCVVGGGGCGGGGGVCVGCLKRKIKEIFIGFQKNKRQKKNRPNRGIKKKHPEKRNK
ncbi:hypothetical protein NF428_10665, partial [Streptococcus suis]|uniref:hypothetical protein n=1 Tax=Streptococcus suis TaxID=1307 RepID=UPI002118BAE1